MADLRLLIRLAAVGIVAAQTTGCTAGHIWARRVEGRVVDTSTGQPIAGATVFTNYEAVPVTGLFASNVRDFDYRWATADAEGRFAIPGHVSLIFTGVPALTEGPILDVIHPTYGRQAFLPERIEDWCNVELRVERSETEIEGMQKQWTHVCRGLSREACDVACTAFYGSVEGCYERGRHRWPGR